MFDVISLGTATYDVFLKSPGMEISENGSEKDICFRYGAKLEVNEIYFDFGGGGTNSAVTFSRQGLSVATIVQVGSDYFGNKIMADLQQERIATNMVNVQESKTDYSTILWGPDGGRTILVYRGNTRLEVGNIDWEKLDSDWFYISSLEGNLEIVEELIRQKKDCHIMWNPGNRELQQKEKVLELLPSVKILNVNKEEMGELLNFQFSNSNFQLFLQKAQKLPCTYVVITDDKRGAYLWDRKNSQWYHSGIFEDAPRVETTGAGDSFGSGLASGFIKGYSLEDCLYFASANASSVIASIGAKQGILRVNNFAAWPKEKLKIEKVSV